MAAFQFPNPVDSQSVTNPVTGITYIWKESPGKWVIQNTQGNNEIEFPEIPTPELSDFNLPYSLAVGERDSETGEDVSTLQILETIALKDVLGNNLGDVAFESAGGIGIVISTDYGYPVIKFETTALQDSIKLHNGRIHAEELRSAVVPRTYTLVNRTGIPTARPGEFAIDASKAQDITAVSFGDTSSEGISIGTVSVGDKLCITRVDPFRQWFYSITSGTTNSGIYGVEFIAENSWYGTGSLPQGNDYILEVFPRATSFGSNA